VYGRVVGVAVVGVRGHPVVVEAHIGRGLPSLTLTGLPGAAVQDARDRIRPAVESSGLEWPLRRVVVNLSPGNLRKDGPGLDLPVAMGVLAASGQVPGNDLARWAFVGELSLRGTLVSTSGVLSVAIAASRAGLRGVVVPAANAAEARLVEDLEVVPLPPYGRSSRSCGARGRRPRRARRPGCSGGAATPGMPSTWWRSGDRRRRAGRSRSPPRAATTSC
jgi:magnesium chelatase family protein